MRIIAGKYKGKPLKENPYTHIRPTTDKVKQAIFTKLQFDVPNAKVLDLFCGTGGLGIEAISRGAKEVIFVDANEKSINLTKENLKSIQGNFKVMKGDALHVLELFNQKFDIILVDPPYESGLYEKILDKIFEKKLLADEGSIVCEHAKKDEIKTDKFFNYDTKDYGSICVTYLTNQ